MIRLSIHATLLGQSDAPYHIDKNGLGGMSPPTRRQRLYSGAKTTDLPHSALFAAVSRSTEGASGSPSKFPQIVSECFKQRTTCIKQALACIVQGTEAWVSPHAFMRLDLQAFDPFVLSLPWSNMVASTLLHGHPQASKDERPGLWQEARLGSCKTLGTFLCMLGVRIELHCAC